MPRQKKADEQQPEQAAATPDQPKQAPKRKPGRPPNPPKPPKAKKPHNRGGATRPTPAERAMIQERRILVYELVKSGIWSFRKIAEHLKTKGYKIGKTTVGDDFNAEIAERKERILNTHVDELLTMAIETTFDMIAAIIGRAKKYGKKDDVLTVQSLWKDIDRYTQFSKTQKSETNAQLALAKLLGVDVDQIPDGSGLGK